MTCKWDPNFYYKTKTIVLTSHDQHQERTREFDWEQGQQFQTLIIPWLPVHRCTGNSGISKRLLAVQPISFKYHMMWINPWRWNLRSSKVKQVAPCQDQLHTVETKSEMKTKTETKHAETKTAIFGVKTGLETKITVSRPHPWCNVDVMFTVAGNPGNYQHEQAALKTVQHPED